MGVLQVEEPTVGYVINPRSALLDLGPSLGLVVQRPCSQVYFVRYNYTVYCLQGYS